MENAQREREGIREKRGKGDILKNTVLSVLPIKPFF